MSTSASAMLRKDWVLDPKVAELVRHKAYELTKSPGFSRSDRPDIEQELTLHLLEKSARFDPSRAKPTTFASRLIEHKAASMVRRVGAKKRSYRRNAVSLNETCDDGEGRGVELAETMEVSAGRRHTGQREPSEAERNQLKIDVAEVNQELSSPLKVLAALLSHVPRFAAGEVLGISRRQTAIHVNTLRTLYETRGLGK